MTNKYGLQEAQDQVDVTVSIEGFESWQDTLAVEVELNSVGVKVLGKATATRMEMCDAVAEKNDLTKELVYFSALIDMGYVLEEIQVEFTGKDQQAWGKCTWIKDHESYRDPNHWWREMVPEATDFQVATIHSWFETENAGQKEFSLQSTAVASGFLFHKSIIFHRIMFSRPQSNMQEVA